MEVFHRENLPVAFEAGGAEIRSTDACGMTISFYRLPAGSDARPLLRGLPGDACPCPHWAYIISGRLRIHTSAGVREVSAGQAFCVEPGHAPEAIDDTDMVEVSPTQQSHQVEEHLIRQLALLRGRDPTPIRPS
jgi:hypothetical protein